MRILKFKRENAYKAKKYSSVICLLFAIFSLGACKEKIDPQITNIEYTKCKYHAKHEDAQEITLECINGYLHVLHKNAVVHCSFTTVDISYTIEDNTIVIMEKTNITDITDCICYVDISYVIGPFENGKYTIIIKTDGTIVYDQIKNI